MDGPITTVFLATLNGGAGFAGHTDWRIPNYGELISIVDLEVSGPAAAPAFHQEATSGAAVAAVGPASRSQAAVAGRDVRGRGFARTGPGYAAPGG